MGPKYEFTGETKNYNGHLLHRIRRIEDGKLGGWIEKEENLSQEGSCWVNDEAIVCDNAKVSGNAQVYGNAQVEGHAQVYDNAQIVGEKTKISYFAKVYGNAHVWWEAEVHGKAEVFDDASVYEYAEIYGSAKIYGDARVCGCDARIDSGEYTHGLFFSKGRPATFSKPKNNETKKVVQDFIYKVDDSSKLTTQTEYNSVDEFFSESVKNDIKLDTLVICTVDTKEPLIKLQKVEVEDKTEFKFIVDITNEDNDDFRFRSIIKSQKQLDQLVLQTIEALKQYPKFRKYADDLEEYL